MVEFGAKNEARERGREMVDFLVDFGAKEEEVSGLIEVGAEGGVSQRGGRFHCKRDESLSALSYPPPSPSYLSTSYFPPISLAIPGLLNDYPKGK